MTFLNLHGTSVAFGSGGSGLRAVLLRGGAGAGKSDLAYRLIGEQGARLVGDDRIDVSTQGGALRVQGQTGWQGLLELRGLGLVSLPVVETALLVLIVDLVPREAVPRLPDPCHEELLGHPLPVLRLHAFDATTASKVRLAVDHFSEKGFPGEDGRLG